MTVLPPGVHYTARALRRTFLPPTLVWIAALIGLNRTNYEHLLPSFFWSKKGLVIASISTTILTEIIKGALQTYREAREMKALGAKPLPTVPAKWPFAVDLAFQVFREYKNEYAGQWFSDLAQELGTRYNLRIMGDNYVFTYEPKDIKQVLSVEFSLWEKGILWQESTQTLFGTGVFNSDGEMWKFHRSMTKPFFSKKRLSDIEILQRDTEFAITKLRERIANGLPVDIQDLAFRLTMDASSEFLLGISTDTLKGELTPPGLPATGGLLGSIKAALENTAARIYIGNEWPLREFWRDETALAMKPLLDYVDPIVDDKIRAFKEGKMDGEHKTLLDDLVVATSGDRTIVRDELLNVLIAGRDPTSHAISSVLYFLATENSTFLKTLRQEIFDVVGSDSLPTLDQLKSMTYLKAVVNESLRLLPPVPFNQRECTSSTTFDAPDGTKYYIPRNTQVSLAIMGVQRRTDLWGEDALQFDPNRWLDERYEKYYLADTSIFMPFGTGPRVCIGQQLALNTTSYFVARIIQAFKSIEFAEEAFPPNMLPPLHWKTGSGRRPVEKAVPKAHVSTFFNGGLWLRLR